MMEDQPRSYLTWTLWGLGVSVIITCIIAAIMLLRPAEVVTTPPPTTLPDAGPTSPGTTGGAGTMTINAKLGPVVTTDFIDNGITGADPQNPGIYYLAGSPGYCLTDGTCPGGARESTFNITYDAAHQFFTIALVAEPLGAVRSKAEHFLLNALGITETQLCTLNYYVGTISALNDLYAGKNLGFSFCPNATVLP